MNHGDRIVIVGFYGGPTSWWSSEDHRKTDYFALRIYQLRIECDN